MNTLRLGSRGKKVIELQRMLNQTAVVQNAMGSIVEDERYGEQTRLAVIAFQDSIVGLKPDGKVREKTWASLEAVLQLVPPTPKPPPDVPPVQPKPYKHPPWYRGPLGWLAAAVALLGLWAAF